MANSYSKGLYKGDILDQGFIESSAKGTPGFFLQFKVLGRYGADGKLEACPQYERQYVQYLANDTGVNILKGDLKAIGVEITDLAQLEPGSPNHTSLVGRQIDMACDIETYKGQPRERWLIPRTQKKLDLSAVRTLDDKFRHVLRGDGTATPPPPVTKPNDSEEAF